MAKPGDAGQRFLDLHRRSGCSADVPVGAGGEFSQPRGFHRGSAQQLYDPIHPRTYQEVLAEGSQNKESKRKPLELCRFDKSAAYAWFQTEPHLAGLSRRRANVQRTKLNSLFTVAARRSLGIPFSSAQKLSRRDRTSRQIESCRNPQSADKHRCD